LAEMIIFSIIKGLVDLIGRTKMKKRYKVLLWLGAGLFLLLVTVAILITQTKFLEKQINLALRSWVERDYPVRITIGDISGNVITGLKLTEVRIDYTEPGLEYRMLRVDTLRLSYSVSDLWNKRWILKKVEVVNPRIELRQAQDGRWLIPKFKKAKGLRKTGLFDFQVEQFSFNHGKVNLAARSDTLTIDSLQLQGQIIKDRNGWHLNLPSGFLVYLQDSLRVSDLKTKFDLKEGKLQFDTLAMNCNWGDFDLNGSVKIAQRPEFDLSVTGRGVILEDLSRMLPHVKLSGKVNVAGKISGDLKSFGGQAIVDGIFFDRSFENVKTSWVFGDKQLQFKRLDGEIFSAPLVGSGKLNFQTKLPGYELNCQVKELDLANIIQGNLHSNFSGSVNLTGKGFSDKEMELALEVELARGKIDRYDFDSASGKMDIDFKRIYFHPGFAARYKHTAGTFSGNLEYTGNIDVAGEVSFGDLTDFWGKTFAKEIAGRGKAQVRVSGLTQDFDLAGDFHSDSAWVYQLYSSNLTGKFDLKTFVTHQRGSVALDFRKGTAWSVPYDSLVGLVKVDSLFVTIDTVYAGNKYAFIQTKGDLDGSKEVQPLRLYKGSVIFEGITFSTREDTVLVDVTKQGYSFRKARMYNGKGSLAANGTVTYEELMDLGLEFRNIDIHPWLELYLPHRQMYGYFSAEGRLKGSFASPRIELNGKIDSLTYLEVNLGKLSGTLQYQDSTLSTDSLVLSSPEWHYLCKGFVRTNLSFTDTASQRLLDLPQQIKFEGEGNKFSVIHLFLPDIEYLKGNFHTSIDITGTPLHPQLNGGINMKGGEIKFDQLKDPVTNLNMDIRMENDKIFFQSVKGEAEGKALSKGGAFGFLFPKAKKKGSLALTGQMRIESLNNFLYDLNLTGRNFPIVYEYMEVSGLADFDLRIEGATPPKVSGQIKLKQLDYEEPFGSPVTLALAGQKVADPSTLWDWDFIVAAANNAWVKNTDMNAEFSGEIEVFRIDGQMVIYGILDAFSGGRFYVAGRSFDIEKGQIIFENVEKPDPTLDLLISSRLYEAPEASASATSSGEKVELTVTGTISQPVIGTPSGSKYTQQEVLEMMVLQSPTAATNGKSSPFQEKVLGSLGADVGSQLMQKFAYGLGVETFYLRPGKGSGFDLGRSEITVGGYLTRGLYWQYTSRFSPNPDLSLQYRLNRKLFLEGTRDRSNVYKLGLNLRWEF